MRQLVMLGPHQNTDWRMRWLVTLGPHQNVESDCCPTSFLLCVQFETPVHGMAPTLKVSLLCSVSSLVRPDEQAQMSVLQVPQESQISHPRSHSP